MSGILLVNKPVGISSHDAVYAVRRQLEIKKVGHAGTLDPLASGLLVMAVGSATRLLNYLQLEPKEYLATVAFGYVSKTFDSEGEPEPCGPVPSDLKPALAQALPHFTGTISQTPPIYSAIKIKGKPAYAYARSGEEVELKSREIQIHALEIESVGATECQLKVQCSAGTYIRTLAHDLGQFLGCGAYLKCLQRTRVGDFWLKDGCELDAISPEKLIDPLDCLAHMPMANLNHDQTNLVANGQRIAFHCDNLSQTKVVLISDAGQLMGIADYDGNFLAPERIFPAEK